MNDYNQDRELSVVVKSFILQLMDEKELERRVKILDKRRGENLRRLRIRAGWSQEQLFKKTGIGQTKISAYENGLGFDKETLIRLCEAFKVKEWEFDLEEATPVVKDDREQQDLAIRRESERLGIADQVREAEVAWIIAAKKKTAESAEVPSGGYLGKIKTLEQGRTKGKKKKTG